MATLPHAVAIGRGMACHQWRGDLVTPIGGRTQLRASFIRVLQSIGGGGGGGGGK